MRKKDVVKSSLKVMEEYLSKKEKDEEIVKEKAAYNRLWDIDALVEIPREEIKSSGYVVDTLEAAILVE